MSEMAGFDAAARERSWKASDEAQLTAGLAQTNPHTLDMQLPPALMEDGAS
jgi:hypothetical protein